MAGSGVAGFRDGQGEVEPTGGLATWLRSYDWGGPTLSPREAGSWLVTWHKEAREHSRATLPARLRERAFLTGRGSATCTGVRFRPNRSKVT